MRHDHTKLAPVLFDFVPKGRTKQDVVIYKVMRWHARKHRQEFWEQANGAIGEMLLYGRGYVKVSDV